MEKKDEQFVKFKKIQKSSIQACHSKTYSPLTLCIKNTVLQREISLLNKIQYFN